MFRESVALCRRLPIWVGLFVVVQMVVLAPNGSPVVSGIAGVFWLVCWIMLSYSAYAALLVGHMDPQANAVRRLFGFTVRTLGLLLITVLLAGIVFGVGVGVAVGFFSMDPSSAPGNPIATATVLLSAPTIAVVVVVVFSLMGTSLPARMVAHRQGFVGTLKLGGSTFWHTAGLLASGPMVLNLVSHGLSLVSYKLATGSFIPTEDTVPLFQPDGQIDIPVMLLMLVISVLGALSVVMGAWVLSKVYLRSVGRHDLASVFE